MIGEILGIASPGPEIYFLDLNGRVWSFNVGLPFLDTAVGAGADPIPGFESTNCTGIPLLSVRNPIANRTYASINYDGSSSAPQVYVIATSTLVVAKSQTTTDQFGHVSCVSGSGAKGYRAQQVTPPSVTNLPLTIQ